MYTKLGVCVGLASGHTYIRTYIHTYRENTYCYAKLLSIRAEAIHSLYAIAGLNRIKKQVMVYVLEGGFVCSLIKSICM